MNNLHEMYPEESIDEALISLLRKGFCVLVEGTSVDSVKRIVDTASMTDTEVIELSKTKGYGWMHLPGC